MSRALTILAMLALAACVSIPNNEQRAPAQSVRYPLDAHVHYDFRYPAGTSGQDYFLNQDRFDHAFLIAPTYLIADVPKDEAFIKDDRNESLIPTIHKEVSEFIVNHAGRFTGLCGLTLAWKNVIKRTSACLRLPGMKGIKIHSNNSGLVASASKNRKKLESVFASTASLRPFILWHIVEYEETKAIYELARQFPDITFMVAHAAAAHDVQQWTNWMQRDGKLQNLWLDVSLSWDEGDDRPKNMYDIPKAKLEAWRKFGFDRIVYGSDLAGDSKAMPSTSSKGLMGIEVLENSSRLTDAEKKAILVDNPKRLLQRVLTTLPV